MQRESCDVFIIGGGNAGFRRHRADVEEDTDRVLGAHFVGHAGEELINLFGLAMQHGITASQIRDFVFAYPTFSADIKSML